jgi:P-type conjugative transfer ATPase TrbB
MADSEEEESSIVKTRAKAKLERDCGPVFMSALRDPRTVELMLNADGNLWQERLGEGMNIIGTIPPIRAQAILKTIASYHGQVVTAISPRLECNFPIDGSRFAGQLPPIVSEVTFALRKKASQVYSLDQYVEDGIMSFHQCAAMKSAVRGHRNILVVGGTGSGKTTLLNALIAEMVAQSTSERFVTLEDTAELQCSAINKVQYYTTGLIGMSELVKGTLRMRPDRILVGEVRDGTALDLLDAWNTGHPGGAASLHADNANSGLTRMKSLISRNKSAPAEIEPLIGDAVHVVVHITRTPAHGRKVMEILEISGYRNGVYLTRDL